MAYRRPCGRRNDAFSVGQAAGCCDNAFWIGPRRSLPNVPSRRGAAASNVAKATCTTSTAPTIA